MRNINSVIRGYALGQTGQTQYIAKFELPVKGRSIKGLVVYNDWVLEPLDLPNGLA